MTINLLLAVASPRDIPQVLDEHPLLPCDILVVKYKQEWPAYFDIREFFLWHKEYTHLVIASDDIIVKPHHIEQLIRDLELTDYDILSGMMNVEQGDLDTINITPKNNIPSPRHEDRIYNWYKKKDLIGKGIIECGFSGFPLMSIRRKVVSEIPFDADGSYNGYDHTIGGALDVTFCKTAHEKGYKIMVDTDIILMHLRREGKSLVGQAIPYGYFRSKGSLDVKKVTLDMMDPNTLHKYELSLKKYQNSKTIISKLITYAGINILPYLPKSLSIKIFKFYWRMHRKNI